MSSTDEPRDPELIPEFAPPPGVEQEDARDDEQDTDKAPEPELPEAPPAGPSEAEVEAIFRTVERATKMYTRKVEEAFGEDFEQYLGCPMCAGDFPGFIHKAKVGGFPRELVSGVNEIMTGFRQVEYKQLPGFQTCPTCGGLGKGYTGSQVPGKEHADCPHCKARGYLAPLAEQANGHTPDAAVHFTPTDEPAFRSDDDVDTWGEPRTLPDGRDNPNYGRMPQFKVHVEPYGVTALIGQQVTG